MKSFAFTMVVFCGLFEFGSTIQCYECNSATDPICSEAVLPNRLKKNCSDLDRGMPHTVCRKLIQYVDHDVNGYRPRSRIIRICGIDDSKYKKSCYSRSGFGGRHEVCSCTTDYCNSAEHLTASAIFVAATMLLLKDL